MKHFLVLALMLRVWWMPCDPKDGCDKYTGIQIGTSFPARLMVRMDNGKILTVRLAEVTYSAFEEVEASR